MSLRRVVTVEDLLELLFRHVEVDEQLGRFGLVRISLAARGDLFCRLPAFNLAWKRLRALLGKIHQTERVLPSISVALDMLRGFVLGAGGLSYEPHHQVLEQQLAAIKALGISEWILRSTDPQHQVARRVLERAREAQEARNRASKRRRTELAREARAMRGITDRRPA